MTNINIKKCLSIPFHIKIFFQNKIVRQLYHFRYDRCAKQPPVRFNAEVPEMQPRPLPSEKFIDVL